MTVLRMVASTWGAAPVRTWQRSSPNVTSRTHWRRFSIPEWPRQIRSSPGGAVALGVRLVMA